MLPETVAVALFGGNPVDKIVLTSKIGKFTVEHKGSTLIVNGERKRKFSLSNAKILEPISASFRGVIVLEADKRGIRVINRVPIVDYLASVVASEMGKAPIEALKAQAVLARTFLLRWGLRHGYAHACDGDHCQVYKGANLTKNEHYRAVRETEGEVLFYGDKPVEVLFHSSCGGWVCEPKYVWKGARELPYFWTGEDTDCFSDDNLAWKVFVPLRVCPTVKRIPGTLRAYMMVVENDTLYANDFRKRFNLPSAVFAYWCSPSGVIFIGTGKGHGTGLCQRGAILKARRGWSYKEILGFYYRGANIVKVK
ncbi:MAG: SpoIID/LytB domain-containing protein [Candidatus Caldipriscus sp.]